MTGGAVYGGGEFWANFAVAALAVWRLAHLWAYEDGPGDFFARVRAWAGEGFWGKLLDCFYCLSLWVAAPFAFWLARDAAHVFLFWLALSGAACLAERATAPALKRMH